MNASNNDFEDPASRPLGRIAGLAGGGVVQADFSRSSRSLIILNVCTDRGSTNVNSYM